MESEDLQVSWNQHGDRSIAKRLAVSDCPPPQAVGGTGVQPIISGQAGSSGPTQHMTTASTTNDNAMRARLGRVQDECATLDLQAKTRRKRRR